jgi:hypothetical protein
MVHIKKTLPEGCVRELHLYGGILMRHLPVHPCLVGLIQIVNHQESLVQLNITGHNVRAFVVRKVIASNIMKISK